MWDRDLTSTFRTGEEWRSQKKEQEGRTNAGGEGRGGEGKEREGEG